MPCSNNNCQACTNGGDSGYIHPIIESNVIENVEQKETILLPLSLVTIFCQLLRKKSLPHSEMMIMKKWISEYHFRDKFHEKKFGIKLKNYLYSIKSDYQKKHIDEIFYTSRRLLKVELKYFQYLWNSDCFKNYTNMAGSMV